MGKVLLSNGLTVYLVTIISVGFIGASTVSPDDYLDWPKIDERDELHAQLRDVVKRLLDEAWIKESWDNDFMIEQLQRARLSDKFNRDEREVVHKIFMVTNGLQCEKEQVDILKSLWVQVQLGMIPKGLQSLIERIGFLFTMACSNIYSSHKKGWTIDSEQTKQLDRVFAAALNDKYAGPLTRVDRVRLARSLREFDLAKDPFNAKRMIAVMSELSEHENAHQEEPLVLLESFMLDRCDKFDDGLKQAIVVIDLSRKFKTDSYWANDYLERLDEYHRICLSLESPEKLKQIDSNLSEQLVKRRKLWIH